MGIRFALCVILVLSSWTTGHSEDKKPDAKAIQRIRSARKAFEGEWKVAEVKTHKPLKEGRRLPAVGDKVKFGGIMFLNFG